MRFGKQSRPDVTPLRLIGLDDRLTDRQLHELAVHTDLLRIPAGEVLVRAGAVATQFIAVIDGSVDVAGPCGHRRVAGPGIQLGATELIGGDRHDITVTARCESTVVVIFGPAFRWTMAPRPLPPTPARARRGRAEGAAFRSVLAAEPAAT
jgi:CRP-like cAMP-binding protein